MAGTLAGMPELNLILPTYAEAHKLHVKARGSARLQPCAHCGLRAAHWAYDGDDPHQLVGPTKRGRMAAYSLDAGHYMPLCGHCHAIFDGAEAPECLCHNREGAVLPIPEGGHEPRAALSGNITERWAPPTS